MGTFYIVGTPIGNLEDLTLRAIRVLGQVDLIAAEDTRVTRKLLNHLELHVPLTSFNQHNWRAKLPIILKGLESGDVALVTDAGMPGISDPGSEAVSAIVDAGFKVETIPGVSAVTTALSVSGISGDSFLFLGFLPRRSKERKAVLLSLGRLPHTLVMFESPHRIKATLTDILAALGNREMAVCRELTKLHEEVFRGTAEQAIAHFDAPRGEFVLVVQGAASAELSDSEGTTDLVSIEKELARLRQTGVKAKEAVSQVAEASGLSKRTVYQMWLNTAEN